MQRHGSTARRLCVNEYGASAKPGPRQAANCQIQKARSHPWISPEVPVRGFVYDVSTGRLTEVFADQETATG